MATTSSIDVENPQKSLEYSKEACELTQPEDWEYRSTLAEAQAINGDIEGAINTITLALKHVSEEHRETLENRLQKYEGSKELRPSLN